VAVDSTVLEPGPIPYRDIDLFGDPDLDHGIRHLGLNPEETAYRLLEIPVMSIHETRSMSTWRWTSKSMIDAMRLGHGLPPIVVVRTPTGWTLIDGVNRTYAAWCLGVVTLRAYELMDPAPE